MQARCGDPGQGCAVSVGLIWHACIAIHPPPKTDEYSKIKPIVSVGAMVVAKCYFDCQLMWQVRDQIPQGTLWAKIVCLKKHEFHKWETIWESTEKRETRFTLELDAAKNTRYIKECFK